MRFQHHGAAPEKGDAQQRVGDKFFNQRLIFKFVDETQANNRKYCSSQCLGKAKQKKLRANR